MHSTLMNQEKNGNLVGAEDRRIHSEIIVPDGAKGIEGQSIQLRMKFQPPLHGDLHSN